MAATQHFGEEQFLGIECESTISVVAVEFCEVAVLRRSHINNVLVKYPRLETKMAVYVQLQFEVRRMEMSGHGDEVDVVKMEAEIEAEPEDDPRRQSSLNRLRNFKHGTVEEDGRGTQDGSGTDSILAAIAALKRQNDKQMGEMQRELSRIADRLDKAGL